MKSSKRNGTNLFMFVHTVASGPTAGSQMPIVGMEDNHLVNTIRKMLEKNVGKLESRLMAERLSEYAPAGMSKEQARILGLKFVTDEVVQRVKDEISDEVASKLNEMLIVATPYIVVGLIRESTHDQVLQILRNTFPFLEQVKDLAAYTFTENAVPQILPMSSFGETGILGDFISEDWEPQL